MRPNLLLSACLLFSACAAESELDEASLSVRSDSQQRPTDHGELGFAAPVSAELTAAAGYHAWEFTLVGDARVSLRTAPPAAGGAAVDTVVYLYREGASGWGSYIGRNDDSDGSVWSKLSKNVGAGHYRALVRGYSRKVSGAFALTATCEGEGCPAPVDTSDCLFGTTYSDLSAPRSDLRITSREILHADTPLTPLAQEQVVAAVQQSSHADVTTVAEAFAAVDEHEINRVSVWEPAASRAWVAYEYGAGDNSYGAIFARESAAVAAQIHDGDLYSCHVRAATCLLGPDYESLLTDDAFTRLSIRAITQVSQLSGVEAGAILSAVQRIHPEATNVADAIAAADDAVVNLNLLRHDATGTQFLAVEFGAGDTSVGTVFFSPSGDAAAFIEDGSFEACAFLATASGGPASTPR